MLCQKKYDEVAYLTTHNAFNSAEDNFQFPNQTYNITSQLESGVRALMIDVYDDAGIPVVYHSFSILGSVPLYDIFLEIKDFLDMHPNEIITVILECYTNANSIENQLQQSFLYDYLYIKDANLPWSTLEDMIISNKRLVIFSDENDGNINQPWYHYIWDYAVETHFSVNNINNFSCNFNRGDSLNDLFIINHFLTDALFGYGLYNESSVVNSNPFFINRIIDCQIQHNKFPNFITVDFFELGDAFAVVDHINDLNTYNQQENFNNRKLVAVIDILGKYRFSIKKAELLFYLYNDGSVEKIIILD